MSNELKATCVCGEGPKDVLLAAPLAFVFGPVKNDGRYVAGSGTAKVQIDLTAQEARALAWQLNAAADQAEGLDTKVLHADTPLHKIQTGTTVTVTISKAAIKSLDKAIKEAPNQPGYKAPAECWGWDQAAINDHLLRKHLQEAYGGTISDLCWIQLMTLYRNSTYREFDVKMFRADKQ